jgi:hypothetical protein
MPHGPVPWEIAHTRRLIIELLPSVIRRSTVQKNCQKGVNTRENALRHRAVYVCHEPRTQPQAIVLSRSLPSRSFSLLEVSQKCSQLIHTSFMAASPAGLRLEISCESDKKKMNFIFDYDKKIFLTGKMKHACRRETKKQCVEKISRANRDRFGIVATNRLRC